MKKLLFIALSLFSFQIYASPQILGIVYDGTAPSANVDLQTNCPTKDISLTLKKGELTFIPADRDNLLECGFILKKVEFKDGGDTRTWIYDVTMDNGFQGVVIRNYPVVIARGIPSPNLFGLSFQRTVFTFGQKK